MPLTDVALRSLAKNPKPGKHADKDGMFLRINKKGGMYWQWSMKTPTATTVSYGPYPEVSLAQAREKHRQTRELRRNGINPNQAKRQAKLTQIKENTNSFEVVAREWFVHRKDEWAPSYGQKIMRRLEVDVFPYLGETPLDAIDPPSLLSVLRRIEARGAIETAHRALENCGQIFRYGVATGRIKSDPSRDLKGALKKPLVQHMAAITDPARLGALLRSIDGYSGTAVVRAALKLAPILMVRPGELRHAEWTEVDFDNMVWTIPAERMKRERDGKVNGAPHVVPLPTQAISILRELYQVTGKGTLLFPGIRHRDRPMSENTVNAALRGMGYDTQKDMTGHGFRATARTILDERLHVDRAIIEAQLAHSVADSLGRAYNRTEFLEQRAVMMQKWADYLDSLKASDVQ